MLPVTQESVLSVLSESPMSWNSLIFHFILDEERQYKRLEKILEKLHMQNKIEVIKEVDPLQMFFPQEHLKHGSMLRFYKFKRASLPA